MLNENFKLKIATGSSRKTITWKNREITWSQLVKKLSTTTTTYETLAEYRKFSKDKQSEIKDVGGFVGGYLKEGKRKKSNVVSRSVLTLDIDFGVEGMWDLIYKAYKEDFSYLVYSTHKHTPISPRLRLIVPLDRDVTPEEYEAIGRKIASKLGMDYFDDTTYEPTRLMFYASTPKDQEFFFRFVDGPLLKSDEVLAEYSNWKDISEWETSSRCDVEIKKQIKETCDNPINKDGVIGAFCKSYNIEDAINYFLKEVYVPTKNPNRYTYVDGSTSGGLVIYDDNFAYSNHSTDPCCGKLCNSFDLVRLHLYGDLDEKANREVSESDKPSFKKMLEFALNDERVKGVLNEERATLIKSYFDEENTSKGETKDSFDSLEDFDNLFEKLDSNKDYDFLKDLEMTKNGVITSSLNNIITVLKEDPNLKDKIGINLLNDRMEILGKLPWERVNKKNWSDIDDSGLRAYFEKVYKIESRTKILDALNIVSAEQSFHPIKKYLESLPKWDGIKRVETLLIDYLGAEDNYYTREVTTKFLIAAITRIYHPGCKFDNMLTLLGKQGIGKSYIFNKLAGEWFSDTITDIQGKEGYEALDSAWIMEMSELSALRKSDREAVKQYISKQTDTYRKAYARNVTENPRHCVFVGTSNDMEFLNDSTGGRRFWVVDCNESRRKKTVWDDLNENEIKQVWAEAMLLYKAPHENINNLTEQSKNVAVQLQEIHTHDNYKKGIIEEFLNRNLPPNYYSMTPYERQSWLAINDADKEMIGSIRTRVCALEIHTECFGGDKSTLKLSVSKEYNEILESLGWKPIGPRKIKFYGSQKCYERRVEIDDSSLDF